MTYDYKITLKKVLIQGAYVLVVGIISVYQNDPRLLAFIPILKGIENYLKHKD